MNYVSFQRRNRPQSAPSGTGKRLRADAGEGPVLYKVFVTTADKKGATTDAKVCRRECLVLYDYLYNLWRLTNK